VFIPDRNGWVDSLITVPGGDNLTITNIDVYVGIQHTYIGDLQVAVIHPDGTYEMLHNQSGGGADNIYRWYSYISTFDGKQSQGEWKLSVRDYARWDIGHIDTWTLRVTGTAE